MYKVRTLGAAVAVGVALTLFGAQASAVPGLPSGSSEVVTPTAESISTAFPRLVPQSAEGEVGYRGATCWQTDREYIPSANAGDPEFGNWAWQWRCYGGGDGNDPFYRIYAYHSSVDVQSVVAGLPPSSMTTDVNNGREYTNHQYTDNGNKIITTFSGDPQRATFLMFTDGYGTPDEVMNWWRAAPLN
ncbi:hypothetical protein [Nocardia caishijiensis]|uniref:Secreted protein n=1 Tax=Nocardia caishijiensis TaxID=184756 RepID=A0ABQ6YV28_9NOCA|nr:hypothetical protein [Nocardia caishijiensis]KAF0849286.1 hypothetical protein FNL39_101724 [Nocardia caishijiensis]